MQESGGTNSYTNAISDIYQDNFDEGIFTGKGIYDLEIFSEVLNKEIPENTVLSHDLLEGCYLRCALASDILLLDGYPSKYIAFTKRLYRWIRGDYQISKWIARKIVNKDGVKKKNPLKFLDKFKILDNIRRSLVEVSLITSIIYFICIKILLNIEVWYLILLVLLSILIPMVLDLISFITTKETNNMKYKNFNKSISGIKSSILKAFLTTIALPHKAYISLDAITKTIYRMKFSKRNLLEWTTAEEAETLVKNSLVLYYKDMFANLIIGVVGIIIISSLELTLINIIAYCICILFIIAPAIFWYISKQNIEPNKIKQLSKDEIKYAVDIGKRTWNYFADFINEQNNYLPPDNFQEDRMPKVVNRTSSTNIGLGLMSIMSAYDLGYINNKKAKELIINMIETIRKLPKWHGHLYNWYNIKTLEPLKPMYVSTVDSGNFVGYLYVIKEFLKEMMRTGAMQDVLEQIEYINNLIEQTRFEMLYDYEKRLFSIGFNVEENKLTDSYYDLLASEARQASLVAIAKHDIPSKHWQNLSRTLTSMNGYKGLVSWSGTAFEYLMPNINIRRYPGSLLDESCKFMVMSQKEYAKKLGIPWGISESAFNLKDLNSNYQYKAFGIPWLGLKRGLADEMVVSSYGSILAIFDFPKEVIQNLKQLEEVGMYQKYGFYEAIDYTPQRLKKKQKYALVKTYMAHHQALILLSINNLINNNVIQDRFVKNAQIKAVDVLLQERMPEDVIITKEKKEKVEKIKTVDYENYNVRTFTKLNEHLNNFNIISNDDYTIAINERGEGYSKYKDVIINRYKPTNDYPEGIAFYIKNIRTKKIWSSLLKKGQMPDKYEVSFMPDANKFVRIDEQIQTSTKIAVAPNEPVEIRTIEIKNNSKLEETFEITSLFEPVISSREQDYAHTAFNNLFLKYEYIEKTNSILVKRNKRGEKQPIYLGVNFEIQGENINELEYETDMEKLGGNNALDIPKAIKNSIPFSKGLGLTTDPIIALKRMIKIKPNEKVTLNLIIAVSESKEKVEENLNKYLNNENVKRAFELSRVKVEEEARYLGLKGSDIEIYQKMLSYLIVQNPLKYVYMNNENQIYYKRDLWKYGISGDNAILLVKIKDANDIYIIKEILKAYEFFRIKNITVDLVILNEEENVYERYVKEAVEAEIMNRHLMYLINQPGGIFILNTNEIEDGKLLEFRANLIINAHKGNIKTIIKELEEDYINSLPKKMYEENKKENIIMEEEKSTSLIDTTKLKYYNKYGGFLEESKEYVIKTDKENTLPVVWCNVLANKNFGSIVTNNASGYTWYKNCKLNRLTELTNNPLVDMPQEIIYIKDKENGKSWTLSQNINNDNEEYYTIYGFGYAKYMQMRLGLLQELTTFVPTNDNVKINILRIKNTMPHQRKIKIIYYIKPVLGEEIIKSAGSINVNFDKDSNIIFAKNLYNQEIENIQCYISSSQNIKAYTGSKRNFIGNGDIKNPEALNMQKLDNQNSLGRESIIAIQLELELKAYEDKEISIVLGEEETKEKMQEIAYQYTIVENCKKELEKTTKYWQETVRTLQVKTPVESMNLLLNGWLVYQTIACRLWARTGFYQSGGAYGYRDQLQDTMGMKYINPELMKEQLIKHAHHQFIEGDVEHWWHEETKKGIRTRFSDDFLWLPYVTSEYINFTGKFDILDEVIPYLKGEQLPDGVDEKYDIYEESEIKESIYMHCIRAIDKGINLGENGLPKIGSGDWNDGFSTVGNKGKGESVWLGFFLYEVLNRFIPICEKKQDSEKVKHYKEVQLKLKNALNTKAWDGRWYKRAFMDDGKTLGTIENEECKIDSIAQSWSVISTAGDEDKKHIAMENLEKYLVDKQNGLIKLLDPAFEKSNLEPGYIKAYLPGVRENGGQYTHECCAYGQFLRNTTSRCSVA